MVRYLDPEDHPELGEERRSRRASPAERLARMRECNAALSGVDALEAAREVALRRLDARQCSRAELLDAITSKGFSSEVAAEVVDRLEGVGLVDDAAFAASLVRTRFALKGAVGPALTRELRRKGLGEADIEAAMAQIDVTESRERARELVARRLSSMGSLPREVAWRRLTGMLARKGYSPGVCSSVVSEMLAGSEHTGSEEEW